MGSLCSSPVPDVTIECGQHTPFDPPAWEESVQTRPKRNPAALTSTVSTTSTTSQVKGNVEEAQVYSLTHTHWLV